MTISPELELRGAEKPRYLSLPPAGTSAAGGEAVELAAEAGLFLDPWQQLVLEAALGERDDRKWAAFEVAVIVPRQNGKGSILEARELAGLFLFKERLILHSAHEFKTAQEAFRRVLFLVQSCPDLDRKVMRIRTSHGEEGIELTNGARLRFVARSTGSGRGFTGDCVILDEAYNLTSKAMAALLPTLSARPNPQLWYTSSAPLVDEVSDVLRKLCKRGRSGESSRLAFLEWSADPDADLDDPVAWAEANPALGIRIGAEFIEAERQALEPAEFARERLGVWHDDEADTVIPPAVWHAAADVKSRALDPVSFAIDVTPNRSHAAIAVVGRRRDGRLHGEVIAHEPGTAWAIRRTEALRRKWRPAAVVLDRKAGAGALLTEFEEARIPVTPIGVEELTQACGQFYDDTVNDRFRHIDQPDLNAALFAAKKREVGDAWVWSRKKSSADISPLVAVTLARWAHVTQPAPYDPLESVR